MRRPYWENKAHEPRDHKNTPSVNDLLKIIKHLVRIEPLKLPSGLPAEEDMANTCLNSRGAGGETSPETTWAEIEIES